MKIIQINLKQRAGAAMSKEFITYLADFSSYGKSY